MTQETFEEYAIHLVAGMPEHHGPKILFLDGHGSRWNRGTILFLMKHKIFPFFFASHTSIWAQPNDGGTNLRLHNCLEEAVRLSLIHILRAHETVLDLVCRLLLEKKKKKKKHKHKHNTQTQ